MELLDWLAAASARHVLRRYIGDGGERVNFADPNAGPAQASKQKIASRGTGNLLFNLFTEHKIPEHGLAIVGAKPHTWADFLWGDFAMLTVRHGRRLIRLLSSVSFAMLILAVVSSVRAQTWDGSKSTAPLDGDNWVGNAAPAMGANVIITGPALHMPVLDGGNLSLGTLFVGHDATLGGATITIANGAALTTTSASIGEPSINNFGDLLELDSALGTVSGASTWSTGALSIGAYGTGVVNVEDGSAVTVATSLLLGQQRNTATLRFGSGTLNVSGTNSQVISNGVTVVGVGGVGTINVSGGAKLTTNATTLGQLADGAGTIAIDGVGSRWDVKTSTTSIGAVGAGKVEITNGGVVSTVAHGGSGWVVLGSDADGRGELIVSGPGSELHASQIRVGGNGSGTEGSGTFSASAGAFVNATHLMLGNAATGVGAATATGLNTNVTASTYAMVGWLGQGALTLSESSALTTPLVLLAFSASARGTLNIGAAAGDMALAAGTLKATEVRFGPGVGTLVFNHTDADLSFAPKLTGTGTLRHVTGTTTLTADNSAFLGATNIEGGLLRVNQSLGGTVNAISGCTLGGSGTVGNTQVGSGGAIAPDGTLKVAGNLGFANGSTYRVDAGNGTADLISASGAVTINGGTVDVQPSTGHFNGQEEHKILSADTALAGTFGSVTSQMAFLDPSLDYSRANEVWLKLLRNDTSFADVGNTPNQQSTGHALSSLPRSNPVASAMTTLTGDQARDAMDQLSGDTHSTVQGANVGLSNQIQNLVINRIRQSFSTLDTTGSASSYFPNSLSGENADQGPTFWLQGIAESGHINPTPGAGGLSTGSAGLVGGGDLLLTDDWRVGFAGGYTHSGFSAIDRAVNGTSDNLHAGVYAGAELDAVRLQLTAQQTWHDLSTLRNVSLGGFSDTLTANYGAQTTQFHAEAGYVFDVGAVDIEPFGSLTYALSNTSAYTEAGGAAALSSVATSGSAAITLLGTRLEAPIAVEGALVTVRGMLGWQHQTGSAPTSQFTLAGSQPFAVTGTSLSGNALVYEAGLNIDINAGLNVDLVYAGQASASDFAHSIKGIIGARF